METNRGDVCTTISKHLVPLNCTVKKVKIVNFIYVATTTTTRN